LRGASVIQKQVLAKISDPSLRVYVVWLPVLPSGGWESAARRRADRIPDPRATRYYDPGKRIGVLYAPILHLPEPMVAWDVYMIFGRDARWPAPGDDQRNGRKAAIGPPAPVYWMHQLGRAAPRELRLDGEEFMKAVNGQLRAEYSQNWLSRGWGSISFLNAQPWRDRAHLISVASQTL